ncbi:MAG: hypothetical protein M5U09_06615 [Gammaproteobacteria bacterium]|nr:hypothetical protein [Gammaproteobacteria bacterium]
MHVGSLIAVLAYFRRDLAAMAASVPDALRLRENRDTRLVAHLALATVPIVFAGFLFEQWIEDNLRSPTVIGYTMVGFAPVLWFADRAGKRERTLDGIDWRIALVIGLAQVIAGSRDVARRHHHHRGAVARHDPGGCLALLVPAVHPHHHRRRRARGRVPPGGTASARSTGRCSSSG